MAAVVSGSAAAGPPPTSVSVVDNDFRPAKSSQILGSSTFWDWDDVANEHNVRQDRKLFYSGPPTDDPMTSVSKTISAGTWHYFCEVHGSKRGGMDGVVKVKPISTPIDPDTFMVHWGDGVDTGDQFDVRYRVGRKDFKSWLKNTSLQNAVFGAGDDPVNVRSGRKYTIQARSEASANPKRASGWSPKLVVNT
jgi:plastocyanin